MATCPSDARLGRRRRVGALLPHSSSEAWTDKVVNKAGARSLFPPSLRHAGSILHILSLAALYSVLKTHLPSLHNSVLCLAARHRQQRCLLLHSAKVNVSTASHVTVIVHIAAGQYKLSTTIRLSCPLDPPIIHSHTHSSKRNRHRHFAGIVNLVAVSLI